MPNDPNSIPAGGHKTILLMPVMKNKRNPSWQRSILSDGWKAQVALYGGELLSNEIKAWGYTEAEGRDVTGLGIEAARLLVRACAASESGKEAGRRTSTNVSSRLIGGSTLNAACIRFPPASDDDSLNGANNEHNDNFTHRRKEVQLTKGNSTTREKPQFLPVNRRVLLCILKRNIHHITSYYLSKLFHLHSKKSAAKILSLH